jgi:alpha-tubulin suppressor-like RCC1 family protein
MGIGYRASGKEEGMHRMRLIERPEDCQNYKKVSAGKFFRLILTQEGKLFFSGQNKKYMVGKDIDTNAYCDKFYEIVNLWPLASDDKLIDVDGGKHFMVACSQKGKVYASGYMFYRAVSEIRHNAEDNEDYPCELRMPEGWLARQVWACDLYCNIWVRAESVSEPGKFQIYAAGGDYDMVGCGDRSGAPNWRKPIFPDDIVMKHIASQGMTAYGIDQNDELWEWGDHKLSNRDGEDPVWEKCNPEAEEKRSTPYKLVWFKQKNQKVVDVTSGNSWALIKSKDEDGNLHIYCWCESAKDGRCGKDPKEQYGEKFVLLGSQINHNDVVDFACTREATFLILAKKVELLPSILPE